MVIPTKIITNRKYLNIPNYSEKLQKPDNKAESIFQFLLGGFFKITNSAFSFLRKKIVLDPVKLDNGFIEGKG